MYVDDNLMKGNMATIDDAIEVLKSKEPVLKIVEGLQDYLCCKIKFSDDEKSAWLGQSHLIKIWRRNLASSCRIFGVTSLQVCLTFYLLDLQSKARRFQPKTNEIIHQE